MTEAAANAIAAGVKVWVPDADEAWVSATVTSVDGDDAVVQVAGAKSAGSRNCMTGSKARNGAHSDTSVIA